MKPVDRSKLLLTAIAGGLLIVAGVLFYLLKSEPNTTPAAAVKTSLPPVLPRPEPAPKPAPAPALPRPVPPSAETPFKQIVKRLTIGIYHQKELIFMTRKESQLPKQDRVSEKTVFMGLSQRQHMQSDRSRRTLHLMESLKQVPSLPEAKKAVAAGVEQMDQAAQFLRNSDVQNALDRGHEALHDLENALSLISNTDTKR
jgi:hypothetical protein